MDIQQKIAAIRQLKESGQHGRALTELEALLPHHAGKPALHHLAAELYEKCADLDQARAHFLRWHELKPNAIAALLGLGRVAKRQKVHHEALRWFERAAEVDPDHLGSLRARAALLLELQRNDDAYRVLMQGLRAHPNDPELARRMLALLLARKDFAQVERVTAQLVRRYPEDEALWRQRFNALREQKKFKSLLEETAAALQRLPDAPFIWVERTKRLYQFGQYEAARDCARTLQRFMAQHDGALLAWVRLQLNLGHAAPVAQRLAELTAQAGGAPSTTAMLLSRALLAYHQGDFAGAIPSLRQVLEADSEHQQALRLLMECQYSQFDITGLTATAKKLPMNHGNAMQILNEIRLFPEIAAELSQIVATAPTRVELVARSGPLVADTPHCLVSTQFWLRQLTYARELFQRQGQDAPAIPHRILQYWHDHLPQDVAATMASWERLPAGFAYQRIDARQGYASLRSYTEAFDEASFNQLNPRIQADLLRLLWLYREGGIWVNADCACRHPFPHELLEGSELVLVQGENGLILTTVVAAAPGLELIKCALDIALEAAAAQPESHHQMTSGSMALSLACARHWGRELAETGRIAGAALLKGSTLKPYLSLDVPHHYHGYAFIPSALQATFLANGIALDEYAET